MGKLSSADMALEGFRLVRERPRAVLAWTLLNLAVTLVSSALTITLMGPEFTQAVNLAKGGDGPRIAERMSLYSAMLPGFLLLLPLMLLYFGVVAAAVNRVILSPDEPSWHGLRMGADELRQAALSVLIVLLVIGLYIAIALPIAIIAALLGVAVGIGTGSGPAGVLVLILVGVSAICLFIFVVVRLSLAGPLTFAQRRVRLFGSWPLTRRRFWPLFGGYLLTWIMLLMISLLSLLIFGGLAAATGSLSGTQSIFNPDLSSFESYFTPVLLLSLPISALVNVLSAAVYLAAPAEAYRQITAEALAESSGS